MDLSDEQMGELRRSAAFSIGRQTASPTENIMEDFSSSEKLGNYLKAYAAFQEEGLVAIKTGKNSFYKNAANPEGAPHSKLVEVIELTKPALLRHGLLLEQLPLGGVVVCRLWNRITHIASGEYRQWISTTPMTKLDPQGMAAATTYLRRTNKITSLDVPEHDDDGNATVNGPKINSEVIRHNPPAQSFPAPVYTPDVQQALVKAQSRSAGPSDAQLKRLFAKTKANGYSPQEVESFIWNTWSLGSTKELSRTQYDVLCGTNKPDEIPNGLLDSKRLNAPSTANGNQASEQEFPIPF